MSWFWGSGSNGSSGKNDNPYKKLDPSLRDFLDQESPSKNETPQSYQTAPPTTSRLATAAATPNQPSTNYRAQIGLSAPDNTDSDTTPVVPRESLFQDGRYAHLWKTYRPKSELEAATLSEQDKLAAVADAYNTRKAAIGRAALENCVLEQMAERDCFSNGNWRQTMTMCRTEGRAFQRCYTMQARFLKALGYLSHEQRTVEQEERIQMHADKLYHEMLAREKAEEDARKEGREAPVFAPLIRHENVEAALGANSAWSRGRQRAKEVGLPSSFANMSPAKQQEIKERIQDMTEQQREVELQLIAAEQRAQLEYADEVEAQMARERRGRKERREAGKETVGDTLKRLWGFNPER